MMGLKIFSMGIKKKALYLLIVSGVFFVTSCGREISSDEYLGRAIEFIGAGDSTSAVIELKNALVEQPENVEARFQLGLVYLRTGNFVLANKEFTRAIEHGLAPHDGYLNMARGALRLELYEDVEKYLEYRQSSWSPMSLASVDAFRAQLLLANRKVYAAEEVLTPLLDRWDEHPDVLYATALLEASKKRFDNAREIINKLLAIDSDYTLAIELGADLSFAQGDLNGAEKGYNDAKKREPGNRNLRLKLAQAYLADGKIKETILELDKLLVFSPNSWYVNYLRSLSSLSEKNYQEGLEFSERASHLEPGHLPSAFVAALSAVGIARYETARLHLDKVLSVLPKHIQSLKLKSYIELKRDGSVEGLDTLAKVGADSLVESDVVLLLLASEYALAAGDSQLGTDFLNKAAGLSRSNKSVALRRAKMAFQHGDYEAGIDTLFTEEEREKDPRLALFIRGAKLLAKSQIVEVRKIAATLKANYPASPEGLLLDGMCFAVMKDFDRARTSFNKALEIAPSNVTAMSNIAVIARKEGELDTARDLWQNVLGLKEDKLQALFQLYEIESVLGNNEASIKWLKRAHNAHPSQVFITQELARYYLKNNKIDQAQIAVENSLIAVPRNSDLLLFAGDLMQTIGNHQLAIDYFSRAVTVTPQNIDANYRLAALYEESGKLVNMQVLISRILTLDISHQGALLIDSRQALRTGDIARAEKNLEILQAQNAELTMIKELQAQIALTSGNMEEARILFTQVLEQRKSSVLVNQFSIALWNTQHGDEAISILEAWLEEQPGDPRTVQRLISYHIAKGYLGKAERGLLIMVETSPDADNQNNLAWVLLEQNKFDQALTYGRQAHLLAPNDPRINDTLAMIYFGKEKYSEAEHYIERALNAEPGNKEFKSHQAKIKTRQAGL